MYRDRRIPFPLFRILCSPFRLDLISLPKWTPSTDIFSYLLWNESSKITTFLLPSGRYRNLCAPMGLLTSEWRTQSDGAIEGLTFTKKIVDDILIWANTLPDLIDIIKIVAERCRKMNIILSKKKFQLGS